MTRMHPVEDPIVRLLLEAGINPTRQRVEIARVLFARKQHLSADQVFAAVNRRNTEISKATAYNTLKLFLDRGMIRELIIDPSKVVYDSNTTPHHHFYNVDTGELTDFPADDVHINGVPALPEGAVADRIEIIIRTREMTR